VPFLPFEVSIPGARTLLRPRRDDQPFAHWLQIRSRPVRRPRTYIRVYSCRAQIRHSWIMPPKYPRTHQPPVAVNRTSREEIGRIYAGDLRLRRLLKLSKPATSVRRKTHIIPRVDRPFSDSRDFSSTSSPKPGRQITELGVALLQRPRSKILPSAFLTDPYTGQRDSPHG